ncbi:30S ribosomal protein [Dirofilaria immitis]
MLHEQNPPAIHFPNLLLLMAQDILNVGTSISRRNICKLWRPMFRVKLLGERLFGGERSSDGSLISSIILCNPHFAQEHIK